MWKALTRMARQWRVPIWLIALAFAAGAPAAAEPNKPASRAEQPQGQTQPAPPPIQAPELPDAYKLNLLIRSSIIALNQANQTGNYTVLADLSAPAFRASNNSVRLAQIFTALRQRQLDLTPVLFFTPKLTAQPQIAPNGLLRLVGFFPTTPEKVNFDLIYQLVEGQWRLFGIGVSTSPADVTSALPQPGGEAASPDAALAPAAQTAPDAAAQPVPPKAAQKSAAPNRKPQADCRGGSKKPNATADIAPATVIQNGATTNNAARIDLAVPKPAAAEPAKSR